MKIVISPSKTTELQKSNYLQDKEPLFLKQHKKVLAQLRKLNKTELAKALSIKGELLNNTYNNIKGYSKNDTFHAFESYNGLVFKNLDKPSYKEEEYRYIEKYVRILDAFYGVLEPGTLIKPYRLDMKSKIGINLYQHWDVNSHFTDEVIVNLASNEFSSMVNRPMITVRFLQNKNGKYVNQATYSKMARGMFLDFMIHHKVDNIDDLRHFNKDNYLFNESLSDESTLTFTR